MKKFHMPQVDARYWLAITLASVFGTNMGDFYAHESGLGIVPGLLLLALVAAAVFAIERLDKAPREAWYWLVIIIIRTGATNIADYLAFRVHIQAVGLSVALALALAALAWRASNRAGARGTTGTAGAALGGVLPDTGASYWVAMLIAGVFGTVLGDVCSHAVGQGVASLVLGGLLALVLVVRRRAAAATIAANIGFYWLTVATARTAGTAIGDWLAENKSLDIGLPRSTLLTGLAFIGVLVLWRSRRPAAPALAATLLVPCVAGIVATAPANALAQTQSDDAKEALRAQADRALVIYKRGKQAYYTQAFDLSGMPHYQPKQQLTGWLRLHGNNYLSDGMLGEYWQQGFAKFQPGVRFSNYLPTSAVAFAALYYNQADLVMAHRPGFYDLLAYERVMGYDPLEITAVTGSFDVGGWENSLTILVNEDNPLKCINMQQLDAIFGAERTGGWAGTNWHADWNRGPEQNIRTWGQLGLTGEWADKPIGVYGFSVRYNTATDFADKVLRGSDKWNEKIQAYGNIVNKDGTRYVEADQITDHLAKDRYGIAYNRFRGERPHVRRLAVAPGNSPSCVEHTLQNVQNRSYPLFNEQYFYVSVKPGEAMDPKVKEFLRYVLSQEGQADIVRDGKYLPLTAEVVREQLRKLGE